VAPQATFLDHVVRFLGWSSFLADRARKTWAVVDEPWLR
jgi:hypothetical protein